jgi:hypothetical protein
VQANEGVSVKTNIGFISTRFSGVDGVTLEASKWEQVFRILMIDFFGTAEDAGGITDPPKGE